jgi:hypothetical protein
MAPCCKDTQCLKLNPEIGALANSRTLIRRWSASVAMAFESMPPKLWTASAHASTLIVETVLLATA